MTDDFVARLRHEGDDEAVEALRFQEASIRRLERELAAAEAKERESFQQYVDANEARIEAEARIRELEKLLARILALGQSGGWRRMPNGRSFSSTPLAGDIAAAIRSGGGE